MKNIVVFSGAGISAESSLGTFRDSGGLWDKYKIEDVATPYAWKSNPELVLDFYNKRRLQASKAFPNKAHLSLVELEGIFNDYFYIFPWERVTRDSVGFDMGCGSGRWAFFLSDRVRKLVCIEPSSAMDVAKKRLKDKDNITYVNKSIARKT